MLYAFNDNLSASSNSSYDAGKLAKEQTSYHNILDAFRLALKGIDLVKKENQI